MSFVSQPCVLGAASRVTLKRDDLCLIVLANVFFFFLESAEIWVLSEAV